MWHRLFVLALGVSLVAGAALATAAVEPETEAAAAAAAYIESLQNPDGGFPAFGEESSPGATIDAVFALVAAGVDPLDVTTDGNSPADYLRTVAAEYAGDLGAGAKLVLSVELMGLDPSDFGGLNLTAMMNDAFEVSLEIDVFDAAFHMFALSAADLRSERAVGFLVLRQLENGGWEFDVGFGADSNTTAMALQALLAAGTGVHNRPIVRGIDYLRTCQGEDGGFGFLPGEPTDPNSTALVIQALSAAQQDIGEGGPWATNGNTPLEALLAFRNPETGAFQYAGEDSPFATYQAVPALMLAPFPDLETRVVEGPTPQAPTVVEVTSTPSPTAPLVLPPSGAGPVDGGWAWGVLAALIAAGAAATGAAVAVRWR